AVHPTSVARRLDLTWIQTRCELFGHGRSEGGQVRLAVRWRAAPTCGTGNRAVSRLEGRGRLPPEEARVDAPEGLHPFGDATQRFRPLRLQAREDVLRDLQEGFRGERAEVPSRLPLHLAAGVFVVARVPVRPRGRHRVVRVAYCHDLRDQGDAVSR